MQILIVEDEKRLAEALKQIKIPTCKRCLAIV